MKVGYEITPADQICNIVLNAAELKMFPDDDTSLKEAIDRWDDTFKDFDRLYTKVVKEIDEGKSPKAARKVVN